MTELDTPEGAKWSAGEVLLPITNTSPLEPMLGASAGKLLLLILGVLANVEVLVLVLAMSAALTVFPRGAVATANPLGLR